VLGSRTLVDYHDLYFTNERKKRPASSWPGQAGPDRAGCCVLLVARALEQTAAIHGVHAAAGRGSGTGRDHHHGRAGKGPLTTRTNLLQYCISSTTTALAAASPHHGGSWGCLAPLRGEEHGASPNSVFASQARRIRNGGSGARVVEALRHVHFAATARSRLGTATVTTFASCPFSQRISGHSISPSPHNSLLRHGVYC
jgi:hypothetical protein